LDDHRAAWAEGSDNLTKADAQTLATEKAMRDRFLIIEPATRSGIREPARITIQENTLRVNVVMGNTAWTVNQGGASGRAIAEFW
jgi:hypothetical protein